MSFYQLRIQLLSDTTFGRGDGVAGLIDQEVEHDANGFPYLRGRTLKGLLSEECDNLVAVINDAARRKHWQSIAAQLFGVPGSSLNTIACMHVGDACLPEDLRHAIAQEITNKNLTSTNVLDSLTTVRRQTAIATNTGVADPNSLRSARVVLRDLTFASFLFFDEAPSEDTLTLLAAGAAALRRIGSGRNRGRGHVKCTIWDSTKPLDAQHLQRFGGAA
ncbi:MAG: RAMP superfamily CRISPR-associated protein [Stenomitos frigidus ULC029]